MKYIELRLGRLTIAGLDRMAKRVEALVQHVWEGEIRFRAFHVHLDELLLDLGHFAIEIVCRCERGFQTLIVAETLV